MQEVVNELTDKYPDVYVRNLAQKHMEDKQVNQKKRFRFSQSMIVFLVDRRSME